jgi:hypothetical protein
MGGSCVLGTSLGGEGENRSRRGSKILKEILVLISWECEYTF